MAYPAAFHRLVVLGTLYTDERFNFTMSIVPTGGGDLPPVDQSLCDAVTAHVASWFGTSGGGTTGPGIISQARMTGAKLNRIGPDGKYADPETVETILGSPIPGAGSALIPAQLACAVTLQTAVPRGRGSKGRFYLPVLNTFSSVGADGRMTSTQADQLAGACAYLINEINDEYAGVARVGVASNIGAGIFRPAVTVRVGRVPDTIRSRRSSLPEAWEEAAIA